MPPKPLPHYYRVFVTHYTSTPNPYSYKHIHRLPIPLRVRVLWRAGENWWKVKPIDPTQAPILYKSGWYVHRSHVRLARIHNNMDADDLRNYPSTEALQVFQPAPVVDTTP